MAVLGKTSMSSSELELACRALEHDIARSEERADRDARWIREQNDRQRGRLPVRVRCAVAFFIGLVLGLVYFGWFAPAASMMVR